VKPRGVLGLQVEPETEGRVAEHVVSDAKPIDRRVGQQGVACVG